MAARSLPSAREGGERIPFYRNVRTIGILAQVLFAAAVLLGAFIVYRNVTSALARSNIPADFSFLDNRAGVPIAETPIPYNPSDSYLRAFAVGVVNTLKVALVGVLLATLLGVVLGVMRISNNWILKQIASVYIETVRNTPLALQIIFWFTAVLIPMPPRIQNPNVLPGGVLLSNLGIALPWLYPSYRFGAWLPWLVAALVLGAALFWFRRAQIARSERPGQAWPLALAAVLLVAATGYFVAGRGLPGDLAVEFLTDRGRGTVFVDADADGSRDATERVASFAPTRVSIDKGALRTFSQDFTESGGIVRSTFRFPPIRPGEFDSAEVEFADPEAADGLSIHFDDFPSEGVIYQDRNGNEAFDPGEELAEDGSGFTGVAVVMRLEGFNRSIVASREGLVRIPDFQPESAFSADREERDVNLSPRALFGADRGGEAETELEVNVDLLPAGPLVLSRPSVPGTNYFGGLVLSTSYLAILLALVVYTASFIAEIVRAGILAVPKGQTEAAKALGLSGYQTFSLVVFPQAMRIILPPMISQYLNLTKNSSLGTLATYAEIFAVSVIIANQTGASVPVILMIIAAYLVISLVFALVLNIVNARMALVER